MKLWYLSHRRPAKASLSIRAVSPEPSLFAHMMYGGRRRVRPKSDIQSHWIAAHARLKNEFTKDEKYHNLMTWLICMFRAVHGHTNTTSNTIQNGRDVNWTVFSSFAEGCVALTFQYIGIQTAQFLICSLKSTSIFSP